MRALVLLTLCSSIASASEPAPSLSLTIVGSAQARRGERADFRVDLRNVSDHEQFFVCERAAVLDSQLTYLDRSGGQGTLNGLCGRHTPEVRHLAPGKAWTLSTQITPDGHGAASLTTSLACHAASPQGVQRGPDVTYKAEKRIDVRGSRRPR